MTSSEIENPETNHVTTKKVGNETVIRKASFKCPVPNKLGSQRIARKVVLPMSTVQALTFKFNELSQVSQVQKHKISQTTVKTVLGVNGKPSTIRVVICRKPSTSKHKRPENSLARKRANNRKFQPSESEILKENNNLHKTVHQKISEFEEMKKLETESVPFKARTAKMQVPKVLVDIDLGAENCAVKHQESKSANDNTNRFEAQANSFSVRTAINLFEKSSNVNVAEKKNFHTRYKPINEKSDVGIKTLEAESSHVVKSKPIAAIRPILKKTEDKISKKAKLSPRDSINRKKYLVMKKELLKEGRQINESFENDDLESVKIDNDAGKTVTSNTTEQTGIKENDKRLKNTSSLHKQILQGSFTVIASEISLNDSREQEQPSKVGNTNQTLKPNTSFLWSKKEESTLEKKSINRMDLPLPVPPENYIPDLPDSHSVNNHKRSLNQDSEEEEFEKLTDSDEGIYDDVGVYWKNCDSFKKENIKKNNLGEQVRVKNMRNEISNLKALDSPYERPEKYFYSYDDGEGERYQYISDKSETIQTIDKSSEFEVYQYIQNNKDNSNIYEDIQSIKCNLAPKDKTKDIYEDINIEGNSVTDNVSINNCYESLYNGIYSNDNGVQPYIKSDVSDGSNNSGKSTYEKSNSLYGMSARSITQSDHCLNVEEVNTSLKNSSYHLNLYELAHPNSDTSQSNSDEWVEISESESEETIYLVHERPRKARAGGNAWMQKERRRWRRLQKKAYVHRG